MLEAQKELTHGKGSNMFLFADEATFAAGNPLEYGMGEWEGGARAAYRLAATALQEACIRSSCSARLSCIKDTPSPGTVNSPMPMTRHFERRELK
jgi:hypothetical protein